jgi:hypothetical protein
MSSYYDFFDVWIFYPSYAVYLLNQTWMVTYVFLSLKKMIFGAYCVFCAYLGFGFLI